MNKWAVFTNAIALWMQFEGYGEVSDISPPTFHIIKKRRSKIECIFKELSVNLDLSDACLCSDFILLCLINKTKGDNVVLLDTQKVKSLMDGNLLDLRGVKESIISQWSFEFIEDARKNDLPNNG